MTVTGAWKCSASFWTRARRATQAIAARFARHRARRHRARPQVWPSRGSVTPYMVFVAEAYILTKDEGGRHTRSPPTIVRSSTSAPPT